jgi:molecular chaperone GrpE
MEMENFAAGEVEKKEENQLTGDQKADNLISDKEPTDQRNDHNTEAENPDENAHADHKDKKKHKKAHDKETDGLKAEIGELKDKYLRLYSEFENFRRRTSKEKLELIKTAGEEVIVSLLPVLDDFERALKSMNENKPESNSAGEGIQLILNKLKYIIEQRGVKELGTKAGDDFNPEIHEAITKISVSDESLKGKIVEVLEKGYNLHDKVIRFAKVVTGS